jgi:hypothetical protein
MMTRWLTRRALRHELDSVRRQLEVARHRVPEGRELTREEWVRGGAIALASGFVEALAACGEVVSLDRTALSRVLTQSLACGLFDLARYLRERPFPTQAP